MSLQATILWLLPILSLCMAVTYLMVMTLSIIMKSISFFILYLGFSMSIYGIFVFEKDLFLIALWYLSGNLNVFLLLFSLSIIFSMLDTYTFLTFKLAYQNSVICFLYNAGDIIACFQFPHLNFSKLVRTVYISWLLFKLLWYSVDNFYIACIVAIN